jgi:hypothetical protein
MSAGLILILAGFVLMGRSRPPALCNIGLIVSAFGAVLFAGALIGRFLP